MICSLKTQGCCQCSGQSRQLYLSSWSVQCILGIHQNGKENNRKLLPFEQFQTLSIFQMSHLPCPQSLGGVSRYEEPGIRGELLGPGRGWETPAVTLGSSGTGGRRPPGQKDADLPAGHRWPIGHWASKHIKWIKIHEFVYRYFRKINKKEGKPDW